MTVTPLSILAVALLGALALVLLHRLKARGLGVGVSCGDDTKACGSGWGSGWTSGGGGDGGDGD